MFCGQVRAQLGAADCCVSLKAGVSPSTAAKHLCSTPGTFETNTEMSQGQRLSALSGWYGNREKSRQGKQWSLAFFVHRLGLNQFSLILPTPLWYPVGKTQVACMVKKKKRKFLLLECGLQSVVDTAMHLHLCQWIFMTTTCYWRNTKCFVDGFSLDMSKLENSLLCFQFIRHHTFHRIYSQWNNCEWPFKGILDLLLFRNISINELFKKIFYWKFHLEIKNRDAKNYSFQCDCPSAAFL